MNFTISRSSFLSRLKIATEATCTTYPNVLIVLDGDLLTIRSTSIETSISSELICEGGKDGSAVIPLVKVAELLKGLPEQELKCSSSKNNFSIVSDQGSYRFSLYDSEYLEPEEIESENSIVINKSEFLNLYNTIRFAVSTDNLRPAMCGVRVEKEGEKLVFVGTNSFVLSRYNLSDYEGNFSGDYILPVRALDIVSKIITERVAIVVSENFISFETTKCKIVSRNIDDTYPSWRTVFPDSTLMDMNISSVDLDSACKRLKIFSDTSSSKVSISLARKTEVVLMAENIEKEKAIEKLACEYNGESLEIALNANTLSKVIDGMNTEYLQFHFTSNDRVVLVRPSGDDPHKEMLLFPVI